MIRVQATRFTVKTVFNDLFPAIFPNRVWYMHVYQLSARVFTVYLFPMIQLFIL